MVVSELIALLQTLPGDAVVAVDLDWGDDDSPVTGVRQASHLYGGQEPFVGSLVYIEYKVLNGKGHYHEFRN